MGCWREGVVGCGEGVGGGGRGGCCVGGGVLGCGEQETGEDGVEGGEDVEG